jgi:hypothetical protein
MRKFFVSSATVYEQVRGGVRAVSPVYNSREEAEAAFAFLTANPATPNLKRGESPWLKS